ncbi:MAG: hypothetical protein HY511_04105 [Actinobacteria bacterium]|nr:hypothetical protein [Actinomycetota bacterium]
MARSARRPARRTLWSRVRRLLGLGAEPPPEPPPPPGEEPALVPAGPPLRPRPSSAVELELPEEPRDLDARSRAPD